MFVFYNNFKKIQRLFKNTSLATIKKKTTSDYRVALKVGDSKVIDPQLNHYEATESIIIEETKHRLNK